MNNDPWFEVPGVCKGHRTLKGQIHGLGPVTAEIRGGAVLDVGCAEGLIAKYLMEVGGAVAADGLELFEPRIVSGRALAGDLPLRFFRVDLDYFAAWEQANPGELMERYRAVLMLSILHKLRRPADFLARMCELSERFIVLRLPVPIINDRRSGNVPLDVTKFLAERGFVLTSEAVSGVQEWLGVFERR